MAKSDFNVEFVNIEIKYPLEVLLGDDELPDCAGLLNWITEANRGFVKISFGYSEKSRSFTATATDSNNAVNGAKPLCMTQHGKNAQSALEKLYFLLTICGDGSIHPARIELQLGEREDYIAQQIVGLLKK